jgi:hypothetical protein
MANPSFATDLQLQKDEELNRSTTNKPQMKPLDQEGVLSRPNNWEPYSRRETTPRVTTNADGTPGTINRQFEDVHASRFSNDSNIGITGHEMSSMDQKALQATGGRGLVDRSMFMEDLGKLPTSQSLTSGHSFRDGPKSGALLAGSPRDFELSQQALANHARDNSAGLFATQNKGLSQPNATPRAQATPQQNLESLRARGQSHGPSTSNLESLRASGQSHGPSGVPAPGVPGVDRPLNPEEVSASNAGGGSGNDGGLDLFDNATGNFGAEGAEGVEGAPGAPVYQGLKPATPFPHMSAEQQAGMKDMSFDDRQSYRDNYLRNEADYTPFGRTPADYEGTGGDKLKNMAEDLSGYVGQMYPPGPKNNTAGIAENLKSHKSQQKVDQAKLNGGNVFIGATAAASTGHAAWKNWKTAKEVNKFASSIAKEAERYATNHYMRVNHGVSGSNVAMSDRAKKRVAGELIKDTSFYETGQHPKSAGGKAEINKQARKKAMEAAKGRANVAGKLAKRAAVVGKLAKAGSGVGVAWLVGDIANEFEERGTRDMVKSFLNTELTTLLVADMVDLNVKMMSDKKYFKSPAETKDGKHFGKNESFEKDYNKRMQELILTYASIGKDHKRNTGGFDLDPKNRGREFWDSGAPSWAPGFKGAKITDNQKWAMENVISGETDHALTTRWRDLEKYKQQGTLGRHFSRTDTGIGTTKTEGFTRGNYVGQTERKKAEGEDFGTLGKMHLNTTFKQFNKMLDTSGNPEYKAMSKHDRQLQWGNSVQRLIEEKQDGTVISFGNR